MWKRLAPAVGALLLAASCPLLAWPVGPAAAQTGSFTFGAAGDFGANSNTSAVLKAVAGAGTDFFVALGDLSYSQVTPESAWCDFVKSRVGTTYPFELISGNHENTGQDGAIANFAACLPDRLGGLTGTYAKEYYYDYPASAPLARMINISPNLAFPGESTYQYTVGSAHYNWLVNAIDSARSAGIPWVIVTNHENCIKAGSAAGSTNCEIGADLQKLFVDKRVDLVLQGHTHTYQRSKQLALGPACSTVINTAYDADCVVNDGSSGTYAKGAGMVLVISGTGGESTGSVSTSDPDAQYFAKLSGSNYGFMKFQVTATQLTARFVPATGTFTDSFTIGVPSGNQAPLAASASVSTPPGAAVPVTLQATDPDDCELSFSVVTPPAHGSLSSVSGQACTPGSPNRDSAGVTYTPGAGFTGPDSFTFKANDGTADSNTATVNVTVGTPSGIAFRAASSAQNPTGTTLTINRPAGVVAGDVMVAGVGIRGAPTVTPPAGWTLIRRDAAGTDTTQALYSRVVTGGEPASYVWSFSSSVPAAGGIVDYQGVDTTTPVDVSGAAVQTTASTSILAPSVTTTGAGDRVVGFFAISGTNSITPPAGMTERGEASSSAGSSHTTWEGSDFTQTTAGATGTRTATATNAHANVGALVALRPGVVGPPPNQAPTASAAPVSTPVGTAVPVTLQASDSDNCELSFSVVSPPAHGSLSSLSNQPCVAGSPNQDSAGVMYTPTAGYTGPDSFTFKANDGTVDSNTATVNVTVTPPPPPDQAPTAADGSVSTPVGTAVPVTLQASDPDSCEVSFSVVSAPAHGSLSSLSDDPCAAGSPNQDSAQVTYTPAAGYTGPDSFTFKADDGTLDSNTATVTVTVTAAPPPPAGITVRSATSGQNPTAATLSIPRPADVVPGDVMVAAVGIRGVPTVTAPAGWTLIRQDAAGTYTTQALYYRVVTATEPVNYLWSFSASVPAAGGITAYTGVNTAAPVNASGGTGQNTNTTSIVAPSVTTTVAGARVVGFFSIGGTNSITPPAGMTEQGEASSTAGSNHVTWEASDFAQTTAGATGPRTASATNPHPNVGALVALTPA